MLFLTTEELEKQGVSRQEAQESAQITCSDKLFTRVANFPRQERSQATELGKNFLRSGVFSFISESQDYLTVWKEKKAETFTHSEQQKTQLKKARATSVSKILTNHRDTSWQAVIQKLADTQVPVAKSLQPLLISQKPASEFHFPVFQVPLPTLSNPNRKLLQLSSIKLTNSLNYSQNSGKVETVISSPIVTSINFPSAVANLRFETPSIQVAIS